MKRFPLFEAVTAQDKTHTQVNLGWAAASDLRWHLDQQGIKEPFGTIAQRDPEYARDLLFGFGRWYTSGPDWQLRRVADQGTLTVVRRGISREPSVPVTDWNAAWEDSLYDNTGNGAHPAVELRVGRAAAGILAMLHIPGAADMRQIGVIAGGPSPSVG